MAAPHLALGREGEDAAAAHLVGKGFVVVTRNFRTRGGEVDLVCRDGDVVVFVEVKTRGEGMRGRPEEAVTPAKRARIVRAAAQFLSDRGWWDRPCRFDVAAVSRRDGALWVEHAENAFSLDEAGAAAGFFQPW